jgi:hypothetical protein
VSILRGRVIGSIYLHAQSDLHAGADLNSPDLVTLACRLHMMDGCMVNGAIKELLLPTHRRLFDYINDVSEALIKLHLKAGGTGLIKRGLHCARQP